MASREQCHISQNTFASAHHGLITTATATAAPTTAISVAFSKLNFVCQTHPFAFAHFSRLLYRSLFYLSLFLPLLVLRISSVLKFYYSRTCSEIEIKLAYQAMPYYCSRSLSLNLLRQISRCSCANEGDIWRRSYVT